MIPNTLHETLIQKLLLPYVQVVVAEQAPTLAVGGLPADEGAATLTSGATIVPASPSKKSLDVAAAILWRHSGDGHRQEVLLTLRPSGRVYAGYWEFPGGKIEAGETAEAALIRELHEELGITAIQPQPFTQRQHDYPHALVRLQFFLVRHWHGTLTLREHDGMVWQDLQHINVAPMLPANEGLIEALSASRLR